MKLAYRFEINESSRLCELCRISNNLYNQALYIIRQSLEHEGKWLFYSDMDKIMKETINLEGEVNYRLLKAKVAQQTLRVLDKAIKSYVKAIKDWKKHPEKYKAKPELPMYHKRGGMSNLYYTNQACKVAEGYITLEKGLRIAVPQWEKYKDRLANFQQVRILPKRGYMIVEVIYEVADVEELGHGGVAGVDLGVNNLATLVCSAGAWLFDGRVAKSYNRWFNKTLARLMSTSDNKSTRRIRKMYVDREKFMNDVMHKVSRGIVNLLVSHGITDLVVGYNKGWKQEVNMGKVNNQKFTYLPFARLKWCLEYKCRQAGIRYVENEESYTSKCDALALEPMGKHEKYSGKRVKRGLFRSGMGKLINADVNGAINIVRKVFGDSIVIAGSGRWYRPVRINSLRCAV